MRRWDINNNNGFWSIPLNTNVSSLNRYFTRMKHASNGKESPPFAHRMQRHFMESAMTLMHRYSTGPASRILVTPFF